MSTKGIISDKKTLNTVIVDDDTHSRKLLGILLKKFPQVKVVGEASNISSALSIIKETKPDSVFLDIKLGANNGFELLDKIQNNAKVIFVSAYDSYALQAFEINALDYLKKPVEKDRLAKTITRLLESNGYEEVKSAGVLSTAQVASGVLEVDTLSSNIPNKEGQNILRDALKGADNELDSDADESSEEEFEYSKGDSKKGLEYDDRLFITADGISKFIKISSIQCITAEKDYSYIYLVGGKKYLILKPMVEWEERLTPKYFVRIHRSTIVNLEYVEKVEKWFNSSYHVYIQNLGEPFQMSRRYASKLKEKFK